MRLAGLAALLALGGCSLFTGPPQERPPPATSPPATQPPSPYSPPATSSPGPGPSVPLPPAPPPPSAEPSVRHYELTAASRALVSQAQAQQAQGDPIAASSTLERAVRIEPRNPLLWIELARLRLATGEAPQAEGLGRKALALATGDARARADAWRVIAQALHAQRRDVEAHQAEERAQTGWGPG